MLNDDASRIVTENLASSEDFLPGRQPEVQPESPVTLRESDADDLFDSQYVLPSDCKWWQYLPDLPHYETDGDFSVMDLYAEDYLNCSSLREDVDSADDDNEGVAVHERVYHLDTRWTTIWGLDIIWEE
ncbi:uncharacterized protein LOC124254545 [Haliotis rubra]|uniref:uncharacterized protein LOC124254545 n=1 Tax=Haliotis rubra TaxID=36100 RepID=UPI001EE5A2CD|nr:uncharacterized protein LOC124254545 [Haliotis rubra]